MIEDTLDVFSDADKEAIRALAAGEQGARANAVAAFRTSLRIHGTRHGCPYFNFMSEVDNPCPDLLLRGRYREAVLATAQ
jgi:hypothetical protein